MIRKLLLCTAGWAPACSRAQGSYDPNCGKEQRTILEFDLLIYLYSHNM